MPLSVNYCLRSTVGSKSALTMIQGKEKSTFNRTGNTVLNLNLTKDSACRTYCIVNLFDRMSLVLAASTTVERESLYKCITDARDLAYQTNICLG